MFEQYHLIDLTHILSSETPSWNGSCGFRHEIKLDYDGGCRIQSIKMHAGIGTHMDAPQHFIPGAKDISEIPLENLCTTICVIDVSKKSHAEYRISAEDILLYEKEHGLIPKNAMVLGYTGWDQFWNDSNRYRNPDAEGNMHFPGFSIEAAQLLLERDVAGIAIDTLSPDGSDMSCPIHHLWLGAGKWIIENVANGALIPAKGAYAIALPLRVFQGVESAIRAIALIPK